jgi:hypothetical protein
MSDITDGVVPARQVRPHTPGPGYHCARCNAPHIAGCVGGNADDGPCPMRAQTRATADAMKAGAETANLRAVVCGLDGGGWAAKIETVPMCTLPPGAGALVVKHFAAQTVDLGYCRALLGCVGSETTYATLVRTMQAARRRDECAVAALDHLRSARAAADDMVLGTEARRVITNALDAAVNLLEVPHA